MRPVSSFVMVVGLVALLRAGTTYRSGRIPLEPFHLSAAQLRKVAALGKAYDPQVEALRRDEKAGVKTGNRADTINKAYSKALLALMTRSQRTMYLEAVYRHVERFLAAHKDVAFDDVFVWGGAYAKRPASHS